MESPEGEQTAENVAAWFAGERAPRASAHFCVDADSIVHCVREQDIAWAAPGANANGVHVELAGRASQTADQWLDEYSTRVLELAAALTADLCRRYSIPPRPIGQAGLLMDMPGITTHAAVSVAFRKSDHTDPGPGFPLNAFVEMVRRRMPH